RLLGQLWRDAGGRHRRRSGIGLGVGPAGRSTRALGRSAPRPLRLRESLPARRRRHDARTTTPPRSLDRAAQPGTARRRAAIIGERRRAMKPFVWLALAAAGLPPAPALAGGRSTLARAAVEAIVRKSGKEAAKEGSEALARRLEAQVARHGVVILDAARQVGPDAVRFVEEAGNHGAVAARLLARYGEKATVLVHSRRALAFVARHGDAAAKALWRHRGIAEPLIEALGESSAKALSAIGPRGGRRLAQMVEDGTLASLGRTREVLAVIGRYGDKAMEFIWKHKGALAVGTVLVAFLA